PRKRAKSICRQRPPRAPIRSILPIIPGKMMFRLDKGKGREPRPLLLLPVLHGETVGMRGSVREYRWRRRARRLPLTRIASGDAIRPLPACGARQEERRPSPDKHIIFSRRVSRPSFAWIMSALRKEGAGKAGWPHAPGAPAHHNCAKSAKTSGYRR